MGTIAGATVVGVRITPNEARRRQRTMTHASSSSITARDRAEEGTVLGVHSRAAHHLHTTVRWGLDRRERINAGTTTREGSRGAGNRSSTGTLTAPRLTA